MHPKVGALRILFVEIKVSNRYLGKRSIIFRALDACRKLIILAKRVNFEIRVVGVDHVEIGRRLILHGLLIILVENWFGLLFFDFG